MKENTSINIIKTRNYNHNHITWKSDKTIRRELISNILYITCSGRKCIICTKHYNASIHSSLKELYNDLDPFGFEYINQSTIVNFNHIKKIENNIVTMDNNVEFEVSRPRRKSVKNLLLNGDKCN
ncbi:MAG: LytR/AlgR family response regulator transcription factor [Lachnospira sp.]